ncbi:hypothetical protein LTR84_011166 [Exophiala bonariae]|uniref:Metallo-beta-lactamase domain-containing protein n=1 Tax=Exophiala bonariae TaxID=1690606 RepID=A0AAV9NJF7_9EURO|nr:hypothetical protein LTR84_011166 [Exophiala bonariae]
MLLSLLLVPLTLVSRVLADDTCQHPSVETYAPIPASAAGPAVSNTTGFRVESFGQGAYLLTDGLYQVLFLVANESVIVVDAPPTIGHNILKGVQSVTDLPISHFVYSHAHADHIGAASLVTGPNVTTIAHFETASELAQVNDPARPAPNVTFADHYKLEVCNQTLELAYKGPNHQPGNLFIYAPLQKVLMLVDIVYPGWVPFENLGESQNIPGYIKAHDQLLEYDFDHYLGGHLNRAGTREDVIIQRAYVTDLYNNCAEAIRLSAEPPSASNPLSAQTALAAIAEANPGNSWAMFDHYVADVTAEWCANKTQSQWLGRLAAVDVYIKSHAMVMVESLRIDFGLLGPFGVASK